MFRILGRIVSGWWPVVLVGWAVVVLGLWYAAPSWAQISKSGQFAYLPADAPSRQAEEMFDQAFPGQRASSRIVLVVTRVDGITLRPSDRVFITNTLTPQLRETLLPGGNPDPDSPALRLLGLLSEAVHLNLYKGTQLYVTVVGYGAGVDYCLFLIARSKEEWETGARARVGVCEAIARVGPAVTASAATVVVGIAMMGFADFGKIRQAGLGIAFSLAVVLVAALTLAPALLCLTGRFALWPETAEQAALHLMIRWRTRVPEASSPPHPEPRLVG